MIIHTEFIKLDQLLKWANLVESGAMAKMVILNGDVKVNGEIETRRGKKIYPGDVVEFNGEKIVMEKEV
ncbi:MAG: S4 domain-containing protein YaaA [Leptotrichia sp.]|jgi:S4 domain protein yaaA|uniref:S4 domain-containing protein YaaA n=1 Tax=Leptotrichia rugosa TaxID=3239302 RepID=A0AB39VH20_9FUSO|nr:S4 domain-containing protein YaaA [Leptotrichia sp. oral taxon 498]ASQ48074.1 RNA-binding protein [Leptotrichia sp. oral taxon 498]RKW35150.1 MAG: S4 domain-containing protein YaaA [Leptotrichia sp.]